VTSGPAAAPQPPGGRHGLCIVGSGWRFTSGISYYTCLLANALAEDHEVSVIPMRQLLPRRLYPGWRRVGQPRARVSCRPEVRVSAGVNWWWGRSMARALRFLAANRPEVIVLQWWTAAVAHSYLLLAVAGRLSGARLVLELHELQDTGEGRLAPVRGYGRWGLRLLLRLCQGCVVHSASDRDELRARHQLRGVRVAIAPHGPFDQYRLGTGAGPDGQGTPGPGGRHGGRPGVVSLLFFGTIRPYKGLEDLLRVFNGLDAAEAAGLWLTVIGETWEGCTEPGRLIEASPHRDRITFVNDYVPDEVVRTAFSRADVVVLPYRRSSSSGPLHVAMSWGLPVVVSRVGGLPEAAAGYEGAVFTEPGDPAALRSAIRRAATLAGRRFTDPRSWDDTARALLTAAGLAGGADPPGPCQPSAGSVQHQSVPGQPVLGQPQVGYAELE
jgi:glycosyltransferase involved in cell wall biosynthesis